MTAAPKDSHTAPCHWAQAVSWFVGVSILLGGWAIARVSAESTALQAESMQSQLAIREIQTDLRYIRDSLARIERRMAHESAAATGQ